MSAVTVEAAGRSHRRSLPLSAWVGLAGLAICVFVGLFGPFFAPYSPDELVGRPFAHPTTEHLLGLDFLGRDALSRFLWGGRTALGLALLAAVVGYSLGLAAGLTSAYLRGWVDELFMRVTDVLLSLPSLIVILLLVAGLGANPLIIVAGVAFTNAPRITRIVRTAALEVVDLPYVEAAKARGDSGVYIATRDILPNILLPILVDFGIRSVYSITLIAGIGFLGFGLQPPAADWGLIVSENLNGIVTQPWAVAGPVVTIGVLTISMNLIADGFLGRLSARVGREEDIVRAR